MWMRELASSGGKAVSESKAAVARANGAKGERLRLVQAALGRCGALANSFDYEAWEIKSTRPLYPLSLPRPLTQEVGLHSHMPTIFIVHGVRYVIYPNDHAPPHVHALGAGWEIVVTLGDGNQIKPSIRSMKGEPTVRQIALVLQAAHMRCAELFRHWRKIHGY